MTFSFSGFDSTGERSKNSGFSAARKSNDPQFQLKNPFLTNEHGQYDRTMMPDQAVFGKVIAVARCATAKG